MTRATPRSRSKQRRRQPVRPKPRPRRRLGTAAALVGAIGFVLALALNYSTSKPTRVASQSTTSTSSDLGVDAPCPRPDGRSVRQTRFRRAPPICITPTHTYTAAVRTDVGSFSIGLDPRLAPDTVNNFVFLARYHFYDGLPLKKIVPGSYIQMGDPGGNSTDAGYMFADELPPPGSYQVGSVLMANSGPDTNGSQFLVLSGPDILPKLRPPRFTLFGQVTNGMDTISRLSAVAGATHVVAEISIAES